MSDTTATDLRPVREPPRRAPGTHVTRSLPVPPPEFRRPDLPPADTGASAPAPLVMVTAEELVEWQALSRVRALEPPTPPPRWTSCMTYWDASRMTVQIAVRLDDVLAETVRAAAAAAGTNLSEWVRCAIRQQAALATALRARAEEDTSPPLYTDEQEHTLLTARRRRAVAAFDHQ